MTVKGFDERLLDEVRAMKFFTGFWLAGFEGLPIEVPPDTPKGVSDFAMFAYGIGVESRESEAKNTGGAR